MTHTNFSTTLNGFQFVNRFQSPFPVKYTLPILGELDLSKVIFGLCGGMCFAALDYFYKGQMVPPYSKAEEIDTKLFTYLCERQLDSLSIPVVLKVIDWMVHEDHEIAARMSRYELPKLKRLLDKGKPAVLALIRVQGLGDPTQNHQVLATGYEQDAASRTITIRLYDPNHPRKETDLQLIPSKTGPGFNLSQGTGEPLRGFFVVPYKPQKNLPKLFPDEPRPDSGRRDDLAPIKLHWPVDSGRVNQYFGENPRSYKPFGLPGHEGVDLFTLSGANIYAAADGEVYEAGYPKGHPYGLHIRIKHDIHNRVYRTVYAHLSEVFVQPGQKVASGERIGLADNTGNSSGSHLHLTLKIDGEQTPGYPSGIVDPWPYLQGSSNVSKPAVEAIKGWTIFSVREINILSKPEPEAQVLAFIPSGEPLGVLDVGGTDRQKVGVEGEWLRVQSASGQVGYVGAWLVQNADEAFPPSSLVVFPIDAVNLRSGPGTVFTQLSTLNPGHPLTVLGDAGRAQARLGEQGEWLQIQMEDGLRGFVAAWLVHGTGQSPSSSGLEVYPTTLLNVRARPSTEAHILTVAAPGDPLAVLGDKDQALGSIGQSDHWLNVRTPEKFVGYAAAWLVSLDAPPSTSPQSLPSSLTVYPTGDINLRAQPSINSPRVGGAFQNEPLLVIEPDQTAAQGKIGKADQWVYVQNKDGRRGWAAAWFLSTAEN